MHEQSMKIAISCTKCSQVAGLIQKVKVGRSSLKALSLRAAVFHSKIIAIIITMHYKFANAVYVCAYRNTGGTGNTN